MLNKCFIPAYVADFLMYLDKYLQKINRIQQGSELKERDCSRRAMTEDHR